MTRLEKLLMRIELLDKVTAPANKIMGVMDKLTTGVAAGFANITGGAIGIWGVVTTLDMFTGSAREMNAALGDVKSLGVHGKALEDLEKRAKQFSITYGESAVDFVRSSYDIWGALPGLAGDELGSFTEAAGLLAKGTKADAALVSDFMGTMYNIFEKQANQMGRANWVEAMAGQIGKAVDIFKTSGKGMSEAFTNLGAVAITRPMEEQVAVLGKLQAVMKGANAGTSYKSFVMGISKAEGALGLSLSDAQGNMLGVVDILRKIQGRVKGMGDTEVNALLAKSFGEPAVAMISNLLGHIDSLEKDIGTIGATPGMDDLRFMVEQMIDPFHQMVKANDAVRMSFGQLINQALTPYYVSAKENFEVLNKWINKYPHLFGALAKLAIWIGVVVAAVSAFAIIKGAAMIAVVGFTTAITILKSPLYLIRAGIWLWNAALAATRILLLTTAIRFPMLITGLIAMKAGFISGAASAWAFAAALLANPITWVVVGVVALIAALAYVVTHWDSVKAAAVGAINWMFEKWQAFRAIIEDNPVLKFIFQPLLLAADFVGFLITNLEKIPQWFSSFKNWLANLNVFDVLMAPAKLALETLNLLPGINIDTSKLQSTNPAQQAAEKTAAMQPDVSQYTRNVINSPALPAATPSPMQIPAVATVAQPAPVVIPAALKLAEPATMQIPAVANIAQPAPVAIPAALQIAEPANLPKFAQTPVPVPNAVAQAEKLDASIAREREQIAPRPEAPVRNVPTGGLLQQINNSNTNNNKGTSIGTLNVNTTQKVDGYSLRDQLLMNS